MCTFNAEKFNETFVELGLTDRKFATQDLSKSSVFRLRKDEVKNKSGREYRNMVNEASDRILFFMREADWDQAVIDSRMKAIFEEDYKPMLTDRTALEDAHLDFYGLENDPFALECDPRKLSEAFTSPALDRRKRRVMNACANNGLLGVWGPIGSGKTSLARRVVEELTERGDYIFISPKFVEMDGMNGAGIIYYMLDYFRLKARQRKVLAQRQLEEHLSKLYDEGKRVVILLDEAHRLSNTSITALKNFYEMGTGGYVRFLSIILFGQKALKDRLAQAQFSEIAQRIAMVQMPELGDAARDYLAHRIALAGGNIKSLFDNGAIEAICAEANTPLAIGNVANAALIAAYKAGEKRVIARFVKTSSEPITKRVGRAA